MYALSRHINMAWMHMGTVGIFLVFSYVLKRLSFMRLLGTQKLELLRHASFMSRIVVSGGKNKRSTLRGAL